MTGVVKDTYCRVLYAKDVDRELISTLFEMNDLAEKLFANNVISKSTLEAIDKDIISFSSNK